jgi:hypothetical protein
VGLWTRRGVLGVSKGVLIGSNRRPARQALADGPWRSSVQLPAWPVGIGTSGRIYEAADAFGDTERFSVTLYVLRSRRRGAVPRCGSVRGCRPSVRLSATRALCRSGLRYSPWQRRHASRCTARSRSTRSGRWRPLRQRVLRRRQRRSSAASQPTGHASHLGYSGFVNELPRTGSCASLSTSRIGARYLSTKPSSLQFGPTTLRPPRSTRRLVPRSSPTRQEPQQLADRILWELARHAEALTFDADTFDESFERLIADLERTEYELPIVAPLPGVKCAHCPIELEPGLEIDLLSDDEVAWCLRAGLIDTFGPVAHAMVGEVVAIRMQLALPKIVGDERPAADASLELERQVLGRGLAVIHALRAFKRGRFSTPGYVSLMNQAGSGARFGPLEGAGALRRVGGDYELTRDDIAAFESFWPQFVEATKRSLTAGAIRRFSYAADRERADDRLTDLVIAGETLFLGDTGEAQYPGGTPVSLRIESCLLHR